MNGTAHAAIGAATGFIVANTFHTSPSTTLFLVGLGGISGLIPDLDIDGKLRGKITLSHKVIRIVAQLIGIMMVFYSFYEGTTREKWIGLGIGIGLMIAASLIKQKHMLTITGIGVIAGGFSLTEIWLILLGIYILIASLVSHRSYTHSILGVVFFGIIASKLERSLGIDGVFYTCLAGYISHLIADFKILPFNKRGIKLFLPVSSKEI
ncbi:MULTISPECIES: metal-dependent hydrolase [unclassified Bacillus (in: firmicutes)]|uniref:metal-dependent hydrolase n=1 Tax=unclassified Bacillus (in: firmicutes) TaxID=185979 RepID=UPI001BE83F70|nr:MULTISPECIES: metal-dependent hydrolase [unclassified Bacillus (in: firmicutes)]MBT2725119.1 metal-dependent hydrolase [Bacillus sp. ISL-46]MBT2744422.1 metal-dependent hydrolase [Bacillus sp. ISL-77]